MTRRVAVVGVIVVASLSVAGVSIALAENRMTGVPTKGTIPEDAFQANRPLDPSMVPDFVETLGPDGQVVGYTARDDILNKVPDSAERTQGDPTPVYADDLKTVVGEMHPGVGFVRVGDEVPDPQYPPTTLGTAPTSGGQLGG
jgi:hypothetical protein